MRPKKERVERELKGKLPPFFTFLFFSMVFFSLVYFLFFYLRRKRCQEKAFEREGLEVRSKSERA